MKKIACEKFGAVLADSFHSRNLFWKLLYCVHVIFEVLLHVYTVEEQQSSTAFEIIDRWYILNPSWLTFPSVKLSKNVTSFSCRDGRNWNFLICDHKYLSWERERGGGGGVKFGLRSHGNVSFIDFLGVPFTGQCLKWSCFWPCPKIS